MNEGEPGKAQIRIRGMALEDLAQVIEIDRASFPLPWPDNSFQFELNRNPAARLWVAELAEPGRPPCITGIIVLWLVIDEGHVGTIAVHPAYRHMGIGTGLLGHGLRQLQTEGAQMVFLEVRCTNLKAQNLYQRFGFTLMDVRKGYYQDNHEDALIYVLDNLQTRDFAWAV